MLLENENDSFQAKQEVVYISNDVQNSPFYKDKTAIILLIDVMFYCSPVPFTQNGYNYKPGEVLTTLSWLAHRYNRTILSMDKTLKLLVKNKIIALKNVEEYPEEYLISIRILDNDYFKFEGV